MERSIREFVVTATTEGPTDGDAPQNQQGHPDRAKLTGIPSKFSAERFPQNVISQNATVFPATAIGYKPPAPG